MGKGIVSSGCRSINTNIRFFELPVSELLGSKIDDETKLDAVAEQLSHINEQLAIKNRRSRRIWKTIAIVFIAIIILYFIGVIIALIAFKPTVITEPVVITEVVDEIIDER